ncbi:tegument protein UL37 [Saimiriine alphaherpesvirus 1]|uniref:Tegument protein UL37 n=1 Tax=Saimiriine herpesvirus 1 (strain MV-5-4-PSL) TaxID=10353 RepID=E2IUD2_SHV1|nr:tegument protein UL37 [Saimiriine alphaherpesvirus 1]ADO13790.1 tegument protein UL37 [Saimiriine alphaherpesvirus 1]
MTQATRTRVPVEWHELIAAAENDLREHAPAPSHVGSIWNLVDTLEPLATQLREMSRAATAAAPPRLSPGAAGRKLVGHGSAYPPEQTFLLVARLRAAFASFLLAPTAAAPEHVRSGWPRLISLLCELHRGLSLTETALLLENLPGLAVHHIDVAVPRDRAGACRDMSAVIACVRKMAGPETVDALEELGLRTSSPLGPISTQRNVLDWVQRWLAVTKSMHEADPRESADFSSAPPLKNLATLPLGQPGAGLAAPKYHLIFGAPFVQRGLRHLAEVGNRVCVVGAYLRRADDAALTPLARALFTLALVDEHVPSGGGVPSLLVQRFRRDVALVDPTIMIPPLEANPMPRTRGEVRISSALSTRTPGVTCAPPGTLITRVRTDSDVFGTHPEHVSASALAVFQPAVSSLLQAGETEATPEVRQRMLGLLHETWARLQNTTSADVALATLVDAGFTPANCAAYLSALEGFLASGHLVASADSGEKDARGLDGRELGEIQQLFGCISILGRGIFQLAREYGPHAEYVKTFKRIQAACEQRHAQLSHAAGLSQGVLGQALARIMSPTTPTEHLAALRRALVDEFEVAERRFNEGHPSLLREPVMAWVDIYGQTAWDVAPPTPHFGPTAASLLPTGPTAYDSTAHVIAAAAICFPAFGFTNPDILTDPGFAPYVMALVVGDALETTARVAYLPSSLAFAVRVLAWARDFGLGYLPSVSGHRTKIGALITLLGPGMKDGEPPPTIQTVESVEQLLQELYQIVRVASEQIDPRVRLRSVAQPTVANSLLLVSMYALSARGSLHELAARADPLAQQLEDAMVLLRVHMSSLAAFFECRFESDGGRLFALPYAVAGGAAPEPRLGPWSPDVVADAVSRYCGGYHDAKLAYTTALAGLRALSAEASALLSACEGLASQAAAGDTVLASALREIGSFSLMINNTHACAARLLTGGQVPGFAPMSRFLARWRTIAGAYATATAAAGPEPVADFVHQLREAWIGLRLESAQPTAETPCFSPEQRALAVREILASAVGSNEIGDGSPGDGSPVTLTDRHNLGAWEEYNPDPLKRPTVYPSSINMTPESISAAVNTEWVMTGHLLQVMDGVFRTSAPPSLTQRSSAPHGSADIEVDGTAARRNGGRP